jgi:hypothetical protein
LDDYPYPESGFPTDASKVQDWAGKIARLSTGVGGFGMIKGMMDMSKY